MVNGIKLYEQLLTFSAYRQENDNEVQKMVYSDMVEALRLKQPNTDEEAVAHVYRVVSTLLKYAALTPSTQLYYEQIHEEVREILAMMAHYLIEE